MFISLAHYYISFLITYIISWMGFFWLAAVILFLMTCHSSQQLLSKLKKCLLFLCREQIIDNGLCAMQG